MAPDIGIHQLPFGRLTSAGIESPNAYLVCGERSSAFLDTGRSDENDHQQRTDYVRRIGAPPLGCIVMLHRHPDHAGGALRLHEETGAPLACHPFDRSAIEEQFDGAARVDWELLGGKEITLLGGLTLRIVHTPGHTPGSLAVYIPELQALFTSDTVLGSYTTAVGDQGDLGMYMDSLEKLQKIEAGRLYPGHGPIVDDPKGRIQFLIDHRKKREHELLLLLETKPRSIDELFDAMYSNISLPRRALLAKAQVRSILRKLQREAQVAEVESGIFCRLR